jgi:hypothetical protein
MRYHFLKTDLPRRLARRLRALLAALGIDLRGTEAQSLFARMYGYEDWAELARITGTVPQSPPDDACPPEMLEARRRRRMVVLCTPEQAKQVLTNLLKPRGKGGSTSDAEDSATILDWKILGDALLANHGRDERFGDHFYRIRPAGPGSFGWNGEPGFELRSGYTKSATLFAEPVTNGHGIFDTIEAAKDEADWLALLEDFSIWPDGVWVEKDEDHPLEGPYDYQDEIHDLGDGVLDVAVGTMDVYRVTSEVMATIPEILRTRIDRQGYGWYHTKQRVLLVKALPQMFGARARRFAEVDMPKSFPAIVAALKSTLPVSDLVRRRLRKEILAAEDDDCEKEELRWMK